jgi:hypothetical protein
VKRTPVSWLASDNIATATALLAAGCTGSGVGRLSVSSKSKTS